MITHRNTIEHFQIQLRRPHPAPGRVQDRPHQGPAIPHPHRGRVPLGRRRGILLGEELQEGGILHLHLSMVRDPIEAHVLTY